MKTPVAVALFGTAQAIAPVRRLTAGSLSCDLCEGQLRNIRWCGTEVVRGISYLLRDVDWGTVPASIEVPTVTETTTAFEATFILRMVTPEGQLVANAHLRGNGNGEMVFEVQATAEVAIQTNRCGLVVLHPASVAGCALRVEHTDGRVSNSVFPRQISPAQPVLDIRALNYSPVQGMDIRLIFEAELPGDPSGKFEMEDQRNWSDASFKTYVASLLDPWPYTLPGGRQLVQRVSLRAQGAPTPGVTDGATLSPVTFDDVGGLRMPAIGVGVPSGLGRARTEEVEALRRLGAGWWIVEADLEDAGLGTDLEAVAINRLGLIAKVQLDVVAPNIWSPHESASTAADFCRRAGLTVDAVRILPATLLKSYQPSGIWPDVPPLEDYASAARAHFPDAQIGGGMFTNFTELNRKRQSASGLDFIGHTTCPIVHAADDHSVMQTIESLKHIAHTVSSIWPGLAYRLGPTSIAPRRNPYGEGTAENRRLERIALASFDPRHRGQFGAAWTIAYAAAVAPLGLDVLAMHDSHGPSGPLASLQNNVDSCATVSAWSALCMLVKAAGGQLVPVENLPQDAAVLAWTHDGILVEGIIANLVSYPTTVRWGMPVCVDAHEPATATELEGFQVSNFRIAVSIL